MHHALREWDFHDKDVKTSAPICQATDLLGCATDPGTCVDDAATTLLPVI